MSHYQGLMKHRVLGPPPRLPESVGLRGREQRVCVLNLLPDAAAAAGLRTTGLG